MKIINIKIRFFLFSSVIKLVIKKTILKFIIFALIIIKNMKIIILIVIAQIKTYLENLLSLKIPNKTKSSNNLIKHFSI